MGSEEANNDDTKRSETIFTLLLRRDVRVGEPLENSMILESKFTLSSKTSSQSELKDSIERLTKGQIGIESRPKYMGLPFIREATAMSTLHIAMFEEGHYPDLDEAIETALEYRNQKFSDLSEKFTNPITFRFVDENNEPICGHFTLHQWLDEKDEDGYDKIVTWYRDLPLNSNGEITIDKFPPKFGFGGTTKDEFYQYWFESSDIDSDKNFIELQCEPSGAMRFEITSFPTNHNDNLAVEYYKETNGEFESVRGIGVGATDPKHTVGGLAPGRYYLELKYEFEDEKPIYRSDPFVVELKNYTEIPDIEITKADIKNTIVD